MNDKDKRFMKSIVDKINTECNSKLNSKFIPSTHYVNTLSKIAVDINRYIKKEESKTYRGF